MAAHVVRKVGIPSGVAQHAFDYAIDFRDMRYPFLPRLEKSLDLVIIGLTSKPFGPAVGVDCPTTSYSFLINGKISL